MAYRSGGKSSGKGSGGLGLKVHNFKKIQREKNKNNFFFFLKNKFLNAYFILEDNQI